MYPNSHVTAFIFDENEIIACLEMKCLRASASNVWREQLLSEAGNISESARNTRQY